MIRSINYCFKKRIIASFAFEDNDTQKFLVGYIEKYNDSEILIAHISPHGYYDGFILKHVEDVKRIDYGGEYEKKVERLYTIRNQTHDHINTLVLEEECILEPLLDFAKHKNYVVTFDLSDSCVSGFVNGYSDDVVYLEVVNDYGGENGISIINFDEILTISVDTDFEQDLRLLASSTGDGL